MGKRSEFTRNERDYYPTPIEAVLPLLDHLPKEPFTFAEPCAGDGTLINHITSLVPHAICTHKSDIEPQDKTITKASAFNIEKELRSVSLIITNPPWNRTILHDMIVHFSDQKPTWLLFDADWAYTEQSITLINRCTDIVPVGRITWIPGTKKQSVDSCAWYRFSDQNSDHTRIHPRQRNKDLKKHLIAI